MAAIRYFILPFAAAGISFQLHRDKILVGVGEMKVPSNFFYVATAHL